MYKKITMTKGDIVLITFPFTNLSASKLRPVVILAESKLDVTVSFITSQTELQEFTDLHLFPNSINGLKKTSLIKTGKIATLDKNLAKGLLGQISQNETYELNEKLKVFLKLS